MKKKVNFEKKIEFSTMIGEIVAISLEKDLKFVDENNIEGNLILTGKYKLTEASRLEEDFSYKIPIEISLTEKIDTKNGNANVEITDFYYEIENNNIINCKIELTIDALEKLDFDEVIENDDSKDRECDGEEEAKEVEIPKKEEIEEQEEIIEDKEDNISNSLFVNLNEEQETYGTFIVYIVRQNETINTILEKYKINIEELEKYNDLNNITIGTKIIIPVLND